jgi:hypothetical protein
MLTHLTKELLNSLIDILVGVFELAHNGQGLRGKRHGERLGNRRCGGKGDRILAHGRILYYLSRRRKSAGTL